MAARRLNKVSSTSESYRNTVSYPQEWRDLDQEKPEWLREITKTAHPDHENAEWVAQVECPVRLPSLHYIFCLILNVW